MCGITGWIDLKRDLSDEGRMLEAMGATMRQRGPDAGGIWLSPHAAFAHRRLIVIDPVGGEQPMVRERQGHKYVLVYNGELYNTDELRQELINHGYMFRSHSDTEVLLIAYMEWGTACVERLNGIFAFAVWDGKEQKLFAARDRLGVKPLFYTQKGSSFLFGSEIKALLSHPYVESAVDATGLAEILALGPGRTPGHGVFKDICELCPGQYLVWDLAGLHTGTYWALESKPHDDDWSTTVATVRSYVLDAVRRQLVSDVPVCTFLSGGLDSSIITVIAAQEFAREGRTLRTFSVDYRDNDRYFVRNDFERDADAPWVKVVANYAATEHHTVIIDTPELTDALKQAVIARDLPGMADVDSSLYLFSQSVKEHATVALSGECADEVFGGYPWFRREDALNAHTFPWSITNEVRLPFFSDELQAWLKPAGYLARRYEEALDEVPRLPGESAREARIREISYLTLTRWMPTLLDRKDRMSMAVGLEVRVPFCDHRLVEYVWNVPWSMRYYKEREKGLLRQAMEGVLPENVLWRPKSPYPKTHNPNYLAQTKALVQEILADPSAPLRSLVNTKYLSNLITSGTQLTVPWFGQLMRFPQLLAYLIQVDFWLREYKVVID